jgi:uncharacterized protein (TIGR02246 family)
MAAQAPSQPPGAVPIAPTAPPAAKPDDRAADRTAVLAAIESLTKSFGACDAKALALHWTSEGEYIGTDGQSVRGRAALEKAYTGCFAKNNEHRVDFEPGEVRFPSRDTAIAEGHMKLSTGKSADLTVSRCSLLLAREDGQWKIVLLREWSGDGHSVRELEFLIGSWSAKRDDLEIHSTYSWTENKAFIRCQFSCTHDGKTANGTQMIGKDPSTGTLRVWTFESEGGIGEATINREANKWKFEARASLTDGSVMTATNYLTPVDRDTFQWQSVERKLNDEPQPDLSPIKVTRVKDKE